MALFEEWFGAAGRNSELGEFFAEGGVFEHGIVELGEGLGTVNRIEGL